MKRYLLFAGKKYYPKGGMNDLICSGDDVEALKDIYKKNNDSALKGDTVEYYTWCHIFDIVQNKIVFNM